ncbi:MAG: rRNA maturation RNase YbeY [Candidatus Zambryskibacteria bacterium]|nr:rRNA maturation RNase YbeY [Candidatus Zambryskibacteria bacterium]
MQFSIRNTTKRRVPRIPFESIKNKILGADYELSLVFCGDALSHKLNKGYRNKDKATNVLAFPLAENSGEIFINLSKTLPAGRQGKHFSILELYVHALLHLNGMEHGAKMEKTEKSFIKRFLKLKNGTPNHRRN